MIRTGDGYRHLRTGVTYTVIGRGKAKLSDDGWVDVIIYMNADGEMFARDLPHFNTNFALIVQ